MLSSSHRAGLRCVAVTGVAALSFVIAGCSSSGDASAPRTSVGPATTTPSASPTVNALDPLNFVYSKAVETASYTVTSRAKTDDVNDPEASPFTDIESCMGVKTDLPMAAADGAELTLDDQQITLDSGAQIVSPALLARQQQEMADPRFVPCVQKVLVDTISEGGGVHLGDLTRRNVPVPSGALARVSFAFPVSDDASGQTRNYIVDLVFLGSRQVENQVLVISSSGAIDGLVTSATAQLVAKLKQQ